MQEFLQNLLNGIAAGSIYALIALGYTMVYGILKLINFAHGDVFMIGSFVGFYPGRSLAKSGGSFGTAIVILALLAIVCALLGQINQRAAHRVADHRDRRLVPARVRRPVRVRSRSELLPAADRETHHQHRRPRND